ncbi:acyl-CoA thioesterase-related [Clonorchis sinensis]|uniref:Acyl-CoA thioesterase-related n=1 Tax=Clonorchis sinensis TaxID=79923 RepID=G7YNC0_CLOSI|nr:acyl-CoA thioesterase-related [Clonorchis sinensis]
MRLLASQRETDQMIEAGKPLGAEDQVDSEASSTELRELISTEMRNKDDSTFQLVILKLLNKLASDDVPLFIVFLVEQSLHVYLCNSQNALPHFLADAISGLLDSSNGKDYVFDSLLPTILLATGSAHADFALNLLETAEPESHLKLLRVLCVRQALWPTDLYRVLQAVLNRLKESLDNSLFTEDVMRLVIHAFDKQLTISEELHKSVQFANLVMYVLRNHAPLVPRDVFPTLRQIATLHRSFLRNPLLQLTEAVCTVELINDRKIETSPVL